jgi:membrane associated rhomboid family serine protease
MTKHEILENYHQSPVTYVIILIVLAVSIAGFANRKLFYQLILHPQSVVRDKQYYRIITADLINADYVHLCLNELMLYVFCTHLEFTLRNKSSVGSIQFLVIYFASLLVASVGIIVRYHKKFDYSTTGTSGSIMGCMFGFMLLDPNYVVFDLPETGPVRNIYAGLIYIVILILYQRRKKSDLVNNEYHFYGAIGGILSTLIMYPEILKGIRG